MAATHVRPTIVRSSTERPGAPRGRQGPFLPKEPRPPTSGLVDFCQWRRGWASDRRLDERQIEEATDPRPSRTSATLPIRADLPTPERRNRPIGRIGITSIPDRSARSRLGRPLADILPRMGRSCEAIIDCGCVVAPSADPFSQLARSMRSPESIGSAPPRAFRPRRQRRISGDDRPRNGFELRSIVTHGRWFPRGQPLVAPRDPVSPGFLGTKREGRVEWGGEGSSHATHYPPAILFVPPAAPAWLGIGRAASHA